MKRYKQLPAAAAALLLGLTLFLVLAAGWHREMASRYPIADLPFVDKGRLEEQVERGNVG